MLRRRRGRLAQPRRAPHDRVEHGLGVGLRVRDGPQDLGGGGLLLERLGDLPMRLDQCVVLLLEFGEQAHVLDGDDRLVGEGPE